MGTKEFLKERTMDVAAWVIDDLWPEVKTHIVGGVATVWSDHIRPSIDAFFADDGT